MNAFTPANIQFNSQFNSQLEEIEKDWAEILLWEQNAEMRKQKIQKRKEIARREDELFGPLPSVSLWEQMENELNDDLESSFLLMEEELQKTEDAVKRLNEEALASSQAEIEFFHPELRVEKVDLTPARPRFWRRGFMSKQWRLA